MDNPKVQPRCTLNKYYTLGIKRNSTDKNKVVQGHAGSLQNWFHEHRHAYIIRCDANINTIVNSYNFVSSKLHLQRGTNIMVQCIYCDTIHVTGRKLIWWFTVEKKVYVGNQNFTYKSDQGFKMRSYLDIE